MFEKLKLKRKIKELEKQISIYDDNQARYDLAMIYLEGTIIKKDEKKAFQLLQTAANNGHIKAKAVLISNKALDIFNTGMDALNDISDILSK